jgi:alpha-beta hydrolase superfamily lysophospholipase
MLRTLLTTIALAACAGVRTPAQTLQTLTLRGHAQTLHMYGPAGGDPVVVSSGDGGWVHLGPHIAEALAQHGYRVIGFDVRAYLTGFTSGTTTLDPGDEPKDYAVLARFAQAASGKKPVLIGVSEGGALSVLGATDPETKKLITGVLGVGLPDRAELGWRWQDAVIYLTHKLPKEPTFSTADVAANVAPVPLAAIHSTNDEFVPLADVQRVVNNAREPKRLWTINASNHRFSNNLPEFNARLFEAIDWIKQNAPR